MGVNYQPGPETAALWACRLQSRPEPQPQQEGVGSLSRRTSCLGKSQMEIGSKGHSSVCLSVCPVLGCLGKQDRLFHPSWRQGNGSNVSPL